MRLLVDSHVLLWHVRDDPRLRPAPTAAIEAEDADVFVSTASLWELAINSALGSLPVVTADPLFAEYGVEVVWE